MTAATAILPAFKLDRTQECGAAEGLVTCHSPLCEVTFKQTGLKIEPRRFCSVQCRQDTWIIKRAALLLANVTDERALEIIRNP